MAHRDQSATEVTLISKGYTNLDDWRSELQTALNTRHSGFPYVLIGVPYHKLPADKKVPELSREDVTWFTGASSGMWGLIEEMLLNTESFRPLGLERITTFTSVRTLERKLDGCDTWTECKPSWASALAKAKNLNVIGDLGSGKLSIHDRNGGILHYYKDQTQEQIAELLKKHSDVPVYATGKWRETKSDGSLVLPTPAGVTLLPHAEEAKYTAMSVAEYIDGPFTMIEMGKGSTQVVTYYPEGKPMTWLEWFGIM